MEKEKDEWKIKYISLVKLDLRDRKIVSILQQNARTPIQDIAKYLSISKAAVIYRINRLKTEKVITGFKTHYRLPPPPYRTIFIQMKNNPKSHTEWMKSLGKYPGVITAISLFGPSNIFIAFGYSKKEEYEKFIQWNKKNKCKALTIHHLTQFQLTPLDYGGEKVNISNVAKNRIAFQDELNKAKQAPITLDKLDYTLMRALHEDARKTLSELAVESKSYKTTIKKRIKQLVLSGTISKFSASVNPYAFPGTQFYICWFQITREEDREKLTHHIKQLWNGHGIGMLKGKWNMMAFLHFHSNIELIHFEEYLSTHIASIKDHQIDLIREQTKLDWSPWVEGLTPIKE